MKLTEKILVGLTIIAIILKLIPIPGGGPFFVISVSALANVYFIFGFALFNGIRLRNIFKGASYTNTSALRIVGAVLMGLALSTVVIGIMFKLQMWPGAGPMLIVGAFPIAIILVIVLVKYILTRDKFYLNALIRCGVYTAAGVVLFFTSGFTLVKIQYRNNPQFIAAYEAYEKNPESEELYNNLEKERRRTTMTPENFAAYEKLQEQNQSETKPVEETEEEPTPVNQKRKFPLSEGWTNDFEHILSDAEIKDLNTIITNFTSESNISIHLVTMDSISRYDVTSEPAYHLMEEWMSSEDEKIVLVLVSRTNRNVSIVADSNTEELLTDGLREKLLNKAMVPFFHKDQYYKGLKSGLLNIIKVLESAPSN